jgi:predicted ArsR family transcriptional regulator
MSMKETESRRSAELASQISAVAALNEPLRRALYTYILQQAEAVGREEAGQAVGINRLLAAFHLDKLVEEGLLEVEYRRISGRSGPGAGRPAKLYRPSGRQVQVAVPERRYDLAADLLAQAMEAPGRNPARALDKVAREFGETLGVEARRDLGRRPSVRRLLDTACEVFREQGFEPIRTEGEIRLRNCPFDTLAKDHTQLVCGMNLALAEGVVAGLQAEGVDVRVDPQPGTCCIALASGRRPRRV